MVDAIIVPLTILVKQVHRLGVLVCVDHVEIKALVLFEKELPRGAPVVIFRNWNQILDWYVGCREASKSELLHFEQLSLGVELHLHDEGLWRESALSEERYQREKLRATGLISKHFLVKVTV